jgi:hypothetical protein
VRWRDRNFLHKDQIKVRCVRLLADFPRSRYPAVLLDSNREGLVYVLPARRRPPSRLSWSDSSGKVICSGVITGGTEPPFLINIARRRNPACHHFIIWRTHTFRYLFAFNRTNPIQLFSTFIVISWSFSTKKNGFRRCYCGFPTKQASWWQFSTEKRMI